MGSFCHRESLYRLPFVDVSAEELPRSLVEHNEDAHSVFLSEIVPVPTVGSMNQYGACAIFTVPRSLLEQQVVFYLIVSNDKSLDYPLPSAVVGYTDFLDNDLQTSL